MIPNQDALARVTQAAFIVNQKYQFLVLQLPNGRWQLPGGKLKEGESWEDGLRREIDEETSIKDLSIIRVLSVSNWHTPKCDYYRAFFLCATKTEAIYLDRSHINYAWIGSKKDINRRVFTHETLKQQLIDFFEELCSK